MSVVLLGERLLLREFEAADFESLHSYASDSEVVRFMEWGPNTEEETREFLSRSRSFVRMDPRNNYELAVTIAASGRHVGGTGLHVSGMQAMLGYCFARSAWGKGFATEAARLMADFGFDSLGLHRVWARCDSENIASQRVLEKLGMRREGLAKHDCQIRGVWRDTFLYAVLIDEWKAQTDQFLSENPVPAPTP